MVLSRRLKYIVRILVWGILGFHIGLYILLNFPMVQGKMASIISSELRKILNTDVSVGHIELGLFNRLHVENVLLNDLQGEEMLNVRRLSARFELKPLLEGRIVINSVQMIGFDIRLKKENPESVPNFQFVLDAFASKDTLKEPTNLDLRINSVLINRGQVSYDVLSEPETPGKFNASHIGIKDLTASISLKALRNDTLNAIVRRLAFEEQSGLRMKKLGLKLIADNNRLNLSHFNIQLPTSTLSIDSLVVTYDSLQNLPKLTDDVRFEGQLKGNLVLKDLAPVVPILKGLNRPLDFSMVVKGQGKNVEIPLLSLADERYLDIKGNLSLLNWDAKQDMFIQTELANVSVTQPGIRYFMNNLTGSVPSILEHMEYIRFKGGVGGYFHNLQLVGLLQTGAGSIDANLLMSSDEDFNRTYSGGIASEDLNLGKLLGDAKLG